MAILSALPFAQSQRDLLLGSPEKVCLSGAVRNIIDRVFAKGDCITVNVIKATQNRAKAADLIENILKDREYPFRMETLAELMVPKRPKRCSFFVLESFADFTKAFTGITPDKFYFGSYFFIVLAKGEIKEIQQIFEMLWNVQIFKVNAMFEDQSDSARVETFFPFSKNKCGSTNRTLVGEFKNGTFTRASRKLLSDKLENLYNCPIRAATSNNSQPYVFAKKLDNGSFHIYGRDAKLVQTLSTTLNFRINWVYVGDEGSLFENGTATGAFKHLLGGKVDLMVADYWLKANRLRYVDNSYPYMSQQIAVVIPPGSELSAFEKFIKPLDGMTWTLLIIFVGSGFVVIYLVGKMPPKFQDFIFGAGIRKPYMNILVAIFGGSQQIVPQRNFARSLLMMFLLFCLVMRTLYTGSLFRFLQSTVYHKEAQSIDDMIERDYKFYTVASILDLVQGQTRINPRLMTSRDIFIAYL